MAEVHHERREDVAILTMDRPVANALAASLRAALLTEIDIAAAAPEVRAIVLRGAGSGFSSGVDVAEYDLPPAAPWVSELCLRIETCPKPVVAALHGLVLGGGFELALAAHGRVASAGTRAAMPEVMLGLVPNGGATQRLPRMVGAQAALALLLSGRAVDVSDPRLEKIIDRIVPTDPLDEAVTMARALADAGHWPRCGEVTAGLSDPKGFQSAIATVRTSLRSTDSAEGDIADCVEAAMLLPYDSGLELEKVRFEDRRTTPEARARRHLFAAERRALVMPEMAHGRATEIHDVAILGKGDLAAELAIACQDDGLRVAVIAGDAGEVEKVCLGVARFYDKAVARRRLSPAARDEKMSRLTRPTTADALARADLILDTGQLLVDDGLGGLKPDAVWAILTGDASTAFEPPEESALGGRCVGLRIYRPAHRAKLVELAVPRGADADKVVTLAKQFAGMGRSVVRCAPHSGLVGNNMSAALFEAALALTAAGAALMPIDGAARALGFAEGPFQMMDREGLVNVSRRLDLRAERRDRPMQPDIGLLAACIGNGTSARAARHGFYISRPDGAVPDPDLPIGQGDGAALELADLEAGLGAALVNEAAYLLSEKIAQRASDIDLVMVRGHAFDAAKGGPLLVADRAGMLAVLQAMKRFEHFAPSLWQPHPMIADMVKDGTGFFVRAQ